MVGNPNEKTNGHSWLDGGHPRSPENQELASAGEEDTRDTFRRLQHGAQQELNFADGRVTELGPPLGRVESWGGISSQFRSRRSADELDLDHFNEVIKKDNVIRAGSIEKKGNGHAGMWKHETFTCILTASLSRACAAKRQ